MKMLALDPSKRSTGWAFYAEGSDRPQSGVMNKIASEYTPRAGIYYQYFVHLTDLHSTLGFDTIYAEEPVNMLPGSVKTTVENIWISVGMGATLELFAYQNRLKLVWAHQAKWRREFLGKMKRGTKSVDLKSYALKRCRQLGLSPQRHDDAEALGVLTYGLLREDVMPPWIANETLPAPLGAPA